MTKLRRFLAKCSIVGLVGGLAWSVLAPVDAGGVVCAAGVVGAIVVYLLGVLEGR